MSPQLALSSAVSVLLMAAFALSVGAAHAGANAPRTTVLQARH